MLTRRRFLRQLGLSAAGLALADRILADPYAPLDDPGALLGRPMVQGGWRAVRVTGRVTIDGRGQRGVAVSDGLAVARTQSDGRYELLADPRQPFLFATVPAGSRIPVTDRGTARFHRPLAADARSEMAASFAFETLPGGDRRHALFLLADPQTQDARDVGLLHAESVPDLAAEVRRMGSVPCLGVACGDIMFDRLEHFPDYERAVRAIGLPCFQVVGNHDVEIAARSDEASVRTFERHFGPTYYSLDRGEVHYVVLDDVLWHGRGYVGYLDQRQIDWLAADLAGLERGARVVVCLHIPPLCTLHTRRGEESPGDTISIVNRELLYALLERFQSTILCGHMHETEFLSDGGCDIHVCGAVCGAWWTGPICHDGTPNGYMVYEVSGAELKPRYKATGHSPEHQMRLYGPAKNGSTDRQVLANVWAAGPGWRIEWYENGERRGPMTARRSRDPLSIRLHEGPEKPTPRAWVEPVATDHVFVATPSRRAREVTVEASDPWGRVSRETITLGAR